MGRGLRARTVLQGVAGTIPETWGRKQPLSDAPCRYDCVCLATKVK